ncbi:uncharacterized protein LOC101863000 [Aplysia californica]|uniref:Uncharacterized protein LOC101863000 n=1 Tax=Aplysia californica TaxID=6500 RepID=A0ABM1AFF3_APLCA|nr:uncharacterized protein LOC101863000 [Aplysia californica]
MKILSHNTEMMFRVLQRREQVLKVACNHLISEDMKLKPLATSETSWCWLAHDFTDSEGQVEQFAVKFKNKDIAQQFKEIFEKCQEDLRNCTSAVEETQPDQEEYDYDEVEDDEEEEERILFEKRATLNSYEDGQWNKLGVGTLLVTYNEDVNGNMVSFATDDGVRGCSHIICREHTITHEPTGRSCEWSPLDYATDEAVRKHLSAAFSSAAAAAEFAKIFIEGQRLAVDSELSENIGKEIDVPEIFSHGEPQK